MFAGINMCIWPDSESFYSPSVARVKMSSEKGQKHIYVQEHQLYYYYNTFRRRLQQKDNN